MKRNQPSSTSFALFLAVTLIALAGTPAIAQTGIALRSFSTTGADGYKPGVVIFDSAGNLYGTTSQGGLYNGGVVYKLTPQTGGGWKEEILHSFDPAGGDGSDPGGLVFDSSGNLYGSCSGGGANSDGTVFKMIPGADGKWSEHTLVSFSGGYGTNPSNVVFDAEGNLYGTTNYGGANGFGSVFQLTRLPDGTWAEKTIYSFLAYSTDGYEPDSGVILDAAGNIYGTTFFGGPILCTGIGTGCGTVYKLSRGAGDTWTETIIYAFADDGIDGNLPIAGVVFDSAGNLYGTTFIGGAGTKGVAFELTPAGSTWTETILHAFVNNDEDGILPGGGSFAADAAGNLYNATTEGGNTQNGTLYKLTRGAGGTFTYATYFKFDGTDGGDPGSNVTLDRYGDVFGPAGGGAFGDGVLFAVKP